MMTMNFLKGVFKTLRKVAKRRQGKRKGKGKATFKFKVILDYSVCGNFNRKGMLQYRQICLIKV